jgi:hypothetical protein
MSARHTIEEEPMDTAVTDHRAGGLGTPARVPVQLWLVVVLMAMSFGAGVIVKTIAEPAGSAVVPTQQVPGITLAPPLTDQQIEQGALPSGHPDLSGSTSGAGNGSGDGSGNGANQGGGK